MNLICVIHALKSGMMVMSVTYCNLGINNLRSFNVWMICDVTGAMCHAEVCGCILHGLSEIVVSCSCGGCVYPGVVIWNGLYADCDDLGYDVIGRENVIWIGFACLNLHGGALNSIWHGDLCVICDVSLEFWKEVFCVGSP